ncbi:extracellular solute-binding protein [Marinospirillum sp.]|uniref:extracellular solute-binding protein n=1 Tax=Marinospirillum sp. TaxID=2183934 RepID=UPI00286FB15F|nr:extracellular solute-binding protein [Marinospirillum sp.]MDR9467759.1 extracellular solute-binding protein [Marinospirillum sp.]
MRAVLLASGLLAFAAFAEASQPECVHALTLHGEPKYSEDIQHLDYVNPDAPKGGRLRQAVLGTFDSFNPFIIRGTPVSGLSNIYDSLTYHTADEPFTEYGLLARCMKLDPERRWIEFHLREEARFHDGTPVTAEDVAFTFDVLRSEGRPFYRAYYAGIEDIQVLDKHRVRFELAAGNNRELPLIIGQIPILPRHDWQDRDFSQPRQDQPLGSGPYRIAEVDSGRRIVYERVEDYWGQDLALNQGRHNFDQLVLDYYRDATVALEAFKAGRLDFRLENIARNWAEGYSGPALSSGEITLESIPHQNSSGMQGFFFNTRKEIFQDLRVRKALTLLFDFEWTNQQLFHGAYQRTRSYYSNSELASSDLPAGQELQILEKFRDQLPERIFKEEFTLPVTDGSGNIRRQMREALSLLQEAGWSMKEGRMVNAQGQPLHFEMLLNDSSFERIVLPWRKNLERLGIGMDVRVVDTSQYLNRLRSFDFDMTVSTLGQSHSPGNEQREYFHSDFADAQDGRNLSGIEDPVVDSLVERLIAARDRDTLVATTRALDRVLLHGYYVIPHWHLNEYRVARRSEIRIPEVRPPYGLPQDTWWFEED